jgi:hypothetical protein
MRSGYPRAGFLDLPSDWTRKCGRSYSKPSVFGTLITTALVHSPDPDHQGAVHVIPL